MTPTASPQPAPLCTHCARSTNHRRHCPTSPTCIWTLCALCGAITNTATDKHAHPGTHGWTPRACTTPTLTKENPHGR